MRRFVVLCATLVVAMAIAGPVAAAAPDREFGGDIPDFVLDDVCAFPVVIHIIANREYVTTFFDRDGNPIRVQINGRLVAEVTRTDTGASVVVNASGPAVIDPVSGEFTAMGLFLQWGDGIDGLNLYRGQHAFDGTGHGSAISVCDLLAG